MVWENFMHVQDKTTLKNNKFNQDVAICLYCPSIYIFLLNYKGCPKKTVTEPRIYKQRHLLAIQ